MYTLLCVGCGALTVGGVVPKLGSIRGLLEGVKYYCLQCKRQFARSSQNFALLESAWKLVQNPYDITHLTLGMLLHYLGKLKIQILCRCSADAEENANKLHLVASSFACLSPHWLQIKFFKSLSFYLFTFVINLWHWKFITADVTAVFVNIQHGIQRRGQFFDKTLFAISMGTHSLF